LDRKYAPLTKT